MNLQKPPKRWESREYREWLKMMFPCMIKGCHHRAEEAHHVKGQTDGGMGRKPSDWWCVPLCASHHRDLHQRGEWSFSQRYETGELRHAAAMHFVLSPKSVEEPEAAEMMRELIYQKVRSER